jgi:hypothetical protein
MKNDINNEQPEQYQIDTKWIRYLLYDSGLTCYRIEKKYGIKAQTTTRIRRGKSRFSKITLKTAQQLVDAGKKEYLRTHPDSNLEEL